MVLSDHCILWSDLFVEKDITGNRMGMIWTKVPGELVRGSRFITNESWESYRTKILGRRKRKSGESDQDIE